MAYIYGVKAGDEIDDIAIAAEAEVARLRTELADVLEVAVSRGDQLGYESIRLITRWQELTGEEWSDE